jgi:hypothetical protein
MDALYQEHRYLRLLHHETEALLRSGPALVEAARQQEINRKLRALQRCLDDAQAAENRRWAARFRTMTPSQRRAALSDLRRALVRQVGECS